MAVEIFSEAIVNFMEVGQFDHETITHPVDFDS